MMKQWRFPASSANAPMSCEPEHGCWCADFPHVLPVHDDAAKRCLCRSCLTKRIELHLIPHPVSRVERYFPVRARDTASVVLLNPARHASVKEKSDEVEWLACFSPRSRHELA